MMKVLFVLLGVLAAAHAVPRYFPSGKIVVYNYTVDVKAGIVDPAPYASQFSINSLLRVQHYTINPQLKNAYHIRLFNVTHQLHNGHAEHFHHPPVKSQLLPDAAVEIENPFVVMFDENGQLQGIKVVRNESKWSINIKKAIASMLQLDLVRIFSPTDEKIAWPQSHSFITHEPTIHGSCQVAYNVQWRKQVAPVVGNDLVVTKIHEPMNCSHFSTHTFNHLEPEKCHVSEEDGMTTASRRVVEISNQNQEFLINKIIGYSVINYFPWLANAEAHYLLTNQTMILESISRESDVVQMDLQSIQFDRDSIDHDITFMKPDTHHAVTGDLDLSQGRHVLKLRNRIDTLKKMLDEAAGYLKENHMQQKEPEWKHGQTINRILHVMSFLDTESLEEVYNTVKNPKDTKEETMKNIFLEMVPNVGTMAACHFTKHVIRQNAVSRWSAIRMLNTLPTHVKMPSESLLLDMEELLDFGDSVPFDVKKASILCFSTLVHRTFAKGTTSPLLTKYLQQFSEHLHNEPSYEMKVVYLMAMKNVAVPEILNILEPIIRGDVSISEKPNHIRIQAIWAITKVVAERPHYTHDLLWPILTNVRHPLATRIAAYDVLMNQLPHTGRLINMYWFMVYEKDEHLYNYHVQTIKSLAESVDPCLAPVQEMSRKILRFTRMRQVPGPLSTKFHVDTFDKTFGHGEAFKVSWIIDQWTGLPYIGSFDHITSVARKPTSRWGVQWHIGGLEKIVGTVKKQAFSNVTKQITNENVRRVLTKVATDMPAIEDIEVCMLVTWNDNVVMVQHYNKTTSLNLIADLLLTKRNMFDYNQQYVLYDDHFEMHVPTDFGVPAVLTTKTPALESLKGNMTYMVEKNITTLQLKLKHQEWKHGEYAMSMYNPIADTWHSIRRTGTSDMVLPIDATVVYDKNLNTVKMTIPRLPVTEHSIAGLLTHAKNYVTITDDNSEALLNSCRTCLHIQNVTGGISDKTHERSVDLKDTGLRFFAGVYNCEGHVTPLPMANWHNEFLMDRPMGYRQLLQPVMELRQKIKNDMISSQGASCSNLIKLEPSTVYPASRFEAMVKVNTENMVNPLHFLNGMRMDIRATMDAKSLTTEESMRKWDAYVNFMLLPGHMKNTMKVVLTRTTPGEKNLKICIDGDKQYPFVDTDLLKFKNEINATTTKVTVTMGQTMKQDECPHDEMDVTINARGELSEEQLSHRPHENIYNDCQFYKQHPDFQTEGRHVPKVWPCVQEAMLHTTLRKYTVNVAIRKMNPFVEMTCHMLEDMLLSHFFPHVSYTLNRTEVGNVKVLAQYSTWTPTVDVTVLQPSHSYELLRMPFGAETWNILMDNVHFSTAMMQDVVNDGMRVCTVHPQALSTYDNVVVSNVVPENEILLSGDCEQNTFAISVKSVAKNRLAMQGYIGEHTIEIVPVGQSIIVTVNGQVVRDYKKGVLVPENDINSYDMKLTTNYDHLNIDSTWLPVDVHYTVNSVTLVASTDLRGKVCGLCGFMNGLNMTVSNEYTPLKY